MTPRTEAVIRKQAYDFAKQCNQSEEEAIVEGDKAIQRMQNILKVESGRKLIDITTGKRVARPPEF